MYSALRGLGTVAVDHCGHDGWVLIAPWSVHVFSWMFVQVKATGPHPVELKYLASSLRKLHSQAGQGNVDRDLQPLMCFT